MQNQLCDVGRLFFNEVVHDSVYSVLQEFLPEVDQQSDTFVGETQVCQKLFLVDRRDGFPRLQLNDHQVFDDQIRAKPDFEFHVFPSDRNWSFFFDS